MYVQSLTANLKMLGNANVRATADHEVQNLKLAPVQWKSENPKEAWLTPYRVFVGKGTAFEKGTKITLNDFLDGVATTILVVDAADAVPWPKPDELEYDASKPLPRFSNRFPEGFSPTIRYV